MTRLLSYLRGLTTAGVLVPQQNKTLAGPAEMVYFRSGDVLSLVEDVLRSRSVN
jgi:hypothetical protein